MVDINWARYPLTAQQTHARTWLKLQMQLGLAANTIQAYGRALEDYLQFCERQQVAVMIARRDHIAAYVHDLATRPNARLGGRPGVEGVGLSNATLQQRLTALRLFYDYLMEEGIRDDHPVGRGRYTPGKSFGGQRERGLLPRYRKLPWIPNDEQWLAVVQAMRDEPLRNRVMFALAYDAGLRREELCSLATGDIDPAHRLLHIRAETTKNRQGRVVPYSEATSSLYAAYLGVRRQLSNQRGSLFLSESRRNYAQPVSIWTWSKVIAGVAARSGVQAFTTHTLRHLRLTDLARADWDVHEIATFAGHRSIQSTLVYIHLSGRELAAKLAASMDSVHTWRVTAMSEMLS